MNRIIGKGMAIIGSLHLLLIPLGVLNSLADFYGVYLSLTKEGENDPTQIAGKMSGALVSTILGLIAVLSSLVLISISILIFEYRTVWIYWVAVVGSVLGLLLFPIGTLLALVLLAVLISKRKAFFSNAILP